MVQQNEIILLLLGVGALIFLVGNRARLRRLPAVKTLRLGFYVLLVGWILTNLEAFLLADLLNVLEHGCYVVSAIVLAVWSWKVFGSPEHLL